MTRAPDVVVVGAGAFGTSVAYQLARRSVSVLLVDEHRPGRATSASAGGLWPVGEAVGLGCGVIHHAATAGAEAAGEAPRPLPDPFRRFLIASSARFPGLAAELLDLGGIEIEYEEAGGLLFVAFDEREMGFMERVAAALPPDERPQLLDPAEAARVEPRLTREAVGAAWLRGEDQVNPMLLAEGFKRAALRLGAGLRPDTQVTGIRRRGDRVLGVELGSEFLACGSVVNAAGAWAGELAATADLAAPVTPVRGQIVLTETLPATLAACLSTSSCYLAQKRHGEILIGSTTEYVGFDVSVTEEAIRALCRGAIRSVPALRRVRVRRVWAGLRPGTPDELPILGGVAGVAGYLNAAGGFRTGIVAAPLAGELVAQVCCGETPDVCLEPYRAERFDAQAARAAVGVA